MDIIDAGKKEEADEELPSNITLEPYVFSPVNLDEQESRFLILKPHNGDPHRMLDCSMSQEPLASCTPYTYVINTRGNPFASSLIPIDGYGKTASYNIGVFLNHIRSPSMPLRLWFRDLCVDHQDPAERAAYWNPEWMDRMIQNAVKIIDLSEIMAELWDKGELPRPYEPRPKDYINLRSGEHLKTRHHPMPLGSFRGVNAPPLPHKYLPLDYCADEIRLVGLWKGTRNEPLRANLAYTPMHGEAGYNCLSYTWGMEEVSGDIILNGQSFPIRPNLEAFLRNIRSDTNLYTFWIDAICIDQMNIAEKNRQIPRMLEIYEAADTVLSWAGEVDAFSQEALELIRSPAFKNPSLRLKNKDWDVPNPDLLPGQLASLYKFFQRPYFRRIWVVQELAAASHPTLIIGKEMVQWRDLDMAAYHLNDILHRDDTMGARMHAAVSNLGPIDDRDLAYVRKLFYFRHLRVRGRADPWGFNSTGWPKIADQSPGILDACVLARDFESTSPHDKIFAIWNLAMDIGTEEEMRAHSSFRLDYDVPLKEMYTQFFVAVAMHTGSLDIICAAENNRSEGLELEEMPSWVPDWSAVTKVSCMVRREHIPNRFMKSVHDIGGSVYHCSSFEDASPSAAGKRFEFSEREVEGETIMQFKVAGLVLDKIKVLGSPAMNLSGRNRSLLAEWLSLAAEHCDRESSDIPDMQKLYQKQFWSMVAGEVTGVWGVEDMQPAKVEGETGEPEGESWFRAVCLVPEQETEGKVVDGKKVGGKRHGLMFTSVDIHRIITRGRRLAVTEKGCMALVPWYAEEGMSLAILNSCSAPVVLERAHQKEEEKQEEGSQVWRYVGSAFVQEWMEGEMLKGYGNSDEDAWREIDKLGRLIIV